MRVIAFISLLVLSLGCAHTRNAKGSSKLNGIWIPVKQEIGGSSLPKAAFEKQSLTINDSSYTLIAESTDKGIVKHTNDKMDVYGKEGVNAGKHFTAIYKFDNEQLTICYNLSGNGYPETFDTKGKPMYFLSVFEKGK